MTIWVVGAAAVWIVGACGLALLLGSALRRGSAPGAPQLAAEQDVVLAVAVPAQRGGPPATPPYGMRSQAYLSCATARPVR